MRTLFGRFVRDVDWSENATHVYEPTVSQVGGYGYLPVFFPHGVTLSALYIFTKNHFPGCEKKVKLFTTDTYDRISTHAFFRYCSSVSGYHYVSAGLVPGGLGNPYTQIDFLSQHIQKMFVGKRMPHSVVVGLTEFDEKIRDIHDRSTLEQGKYGALRDLMSLRLVRDFLPSPLEVVMWFIMMNELQIGSISKTSLRIMTNHMVHDSGLVTVGPLQNGETEDSGLDITWARIHRGDKPTDLRTMCFFRENHRLCSCLSTTWLS